MDFFYLLVDFVFGFAEENFCVSLFSAHHRSLAKRCEKTETSRMNFVIRLYLLLLPM